MNKPTWMQGLLDAEKMYLEHEYNQIQLYDYVNSESEVLSQDYRWNEWLNGFHSYITHLNDCMRRGVKLK